MIGSVQFAIQSSASTSYSAMDEAFLPGLASNRLKLRAGLGYFWSDFVILVVLPVNSSLIILVAKFELPWLHVAVEISSSVLYY